MASRKQLVQSEIQVQASIAQPEPGFVSLGPKADGLYQRRYGHPEEKLALDIPLWVAQNNHGFFVGEAVRPTSLGWVKTKADTRENAGTVGFVSKVMDVNNFTCIESGELPGSFSAGAVYFLSTTTAGAIIVQPDPEVWAEGQVREVVGTANSDGSALIVQISQGQVITAALFEQNYIESGEVNGSAILIVHQSNAPDVAIPLPAYQPISNVLSQIAAITSGTGLLRKTSTGWELDLASGWNNSVQVLSGACVTFDPNNGLHSRMSVTTNVTLTFINLVAGQSGNITVLNPVNVYSITCTGTYAFDISQAVLAYGHTLACSGVNRKDRYSWYYDGVSVSMNGQLDYK